MVPPSSPCSGGSNVLSALTPGASVDSTVAPLTAASSRRAVTSTSGSSGIATRLGSNAAMHPWVQQQAAEIARGAERQLEALVGVSSPSGDVKAAEECAAVCAALLPDEAEVERVPCSSPGHAPDLVARLRGTGRARVLLLGHVDTVVPHEAHQPVARDGERLLGSGTVDMKGGDVLALGACARSPLRPEAFAEAALLLVSTRSGGPRRSRTPSASPASTPACASRPGSAPRRPRAWSSSARRPGRSASPPGRTAHSGSAPDGGAQRAARPGRRRAGRGRPPRPRGPAT